MAQHLPADVLAGITGRLPPRSLASFRCACRAWRDAVDARGLLRPDCLLPRTLGGIFCNLNETKTSQFFAHPSVRCTISGYLHYKIRNDVHDHCGGLLLLRNHSVANPATRQCAILPQPPPSRVGDRDVSWYRSYLIYDPAVSPHYEVLSVPNSDHYWEHRLETSPHHLRMFSSRTWQWEETTFLHEGEPVVAGMALWLSERYGVYWQDALYVYWHANAITRISLTTKKYRLIQLPHKQPATVYLGKSNKGVYSAYMEDSRLWIWFLNGSMEWVLKHNSYLKPTLPQIDDTVRTSSFRILGFHPYKKVIFLEEKMGKGVAYHWKSSKYQYRGRIYTESYRDDAYFQASITASFPYTPCWIDLLQGKFY